MQLWGSLLHFWRNLLETERGGPRIFHFTGTLSSVAIALLICFWKLDHGVGEDLGYIARGTTIVGRTLLPTFNQSWDLALNNLAILEHVLVYTSKNTREKKLTKKDLVRGFLSNLLSLWQLELLSQSFDIVLGLDNMDVFRLDGAVIFGNHVHLASLESRERRKALAGINVAWQPEQPTTHD